MAGDRSLISVATANRIARRVAYLLEYHFKKNCHYVLENPLSSLLWRFRCIHRCLQRHGAKRVVVYLGAYGAHTLKPVFLPGKEHTLMGFEMLQPFDGSPVGWLADIFRALFSTSCLYIYIYDIHTYLF